jgi:hypothetical protein
MSGRLGSLAVFFLFPLSPGRPTVEGTTEAIPLFISSGQQKRVHALSVSANESQTLAGTAVIAAFRSRTRVTTQPQLCKKTFAGQNPGFRFAALS